MYIHLKSHNGLFTVVKYSPSCVTVKTKHREEFNIDWGNFKCFAKGLWNHRVPSNQIFAFMKAYEKAKRYGFNTYGKWD